MKKLVLLAASLTVASVMDSAHAYRGEASSKHAQVTMEQARAVALRAHPGKITDEELEREGGGSSLRYSFDIRSGNVTQEVGVDAKTGKVLPCLCLSVGDKPGARDEKRESHGAVGPAKSETGCPNNGQK